MNYKSHTEKEVIEAQKAGKVIVSLDTGGDGDDDTFILGEGENVQDLIPDILLYHSLEKFPEHWTLEIVDWEIE